MKAIFIRTIIYFIDCNLEFSPQKAIDQAVLDSSLAK
jgi:hypothetical protein